MIYARGIMYRSALHCVVYDDVLRIVLLYFDGAPKRRIHHFSFNYVVTFNRFHISMGNSNFFKKKQ